MLFAGAVYMSRVSISWEAAGVFLQFNNNLRHFVFFFLIFVLCARLHLLCVCPGQLQPDHTASQSFFITPDTSMAKVVYVAINLDITEKNLILTACRTVNFYAPQDQLRTCKEM